MSAHIQPTKANKTLYPTAGNAPVWIRASLPAVDELYLRQEIKMSEILQQTITLGYTREGQIRMILSSYGLPEIEVERLMKLPDCRNNIAWVADHVAAWRTNQNIRKDILAAVGYSPEEAEEVAKKFTGQPTLEWGRRMAAIRDRPRDTKLFSILALAGIILFILAASNLVTGTVEWVIGLAGLGLSSFAIAGLYHLYNESKKEA